MWGEEDHVAQCILLPKCLRLPRHLCIYHLLKDQAKRTPNAPAILAPGRAPLTYGRLYGHIDDVVQTLHAMGLSRNDRVAVVLPNGPEMAVAFLAVAAGATCAPLNPAYSANEFDFYLTDLNAKALIVQAGMDSPARAVAQERGIRIIELSPMLEAEAGLFTLTGEEHHVRRASWVRSARRCGVSAAYFRHDITAENCAADTYQYLYSAHDMRLLLPWSRAIAA